jgi:phosphohistidine phosphatase
VRKLFLLRHAKSSWDDPGLADHDRPLAPRGRRAAKVIAAHLRDQGIAPELVLCSSSQRTRETLERIAPALADGVVLEIEREFYAAPASTLLSRLQAVGDDVESVMLIGHNPGIEQLALTLAGDGEKLAEVRRKYQTAALATLEFEGRWRELEPGAARLADFVKPKQLANG